MKRYLVLALVLAIAMTAHSQMTIKLSKPISTSSACQDAGDQWNTALKSTSNGKPFNVIVFNDSAQACYSSSSKFVASNPFYVGVLTTTPDSWALPTIDPCGLESASPVVLAPAALVPAALAPTGKLIRFGPYFCTAPKVTITMTQGTGTDGKSGAYSFDQYQRYHATLQVGLLSTAHNDQSFSLVKSGDQNLIFSQGPEGRQIVSTATIVIYAIPRYLSNHHYAGRDPVNDMDTIDKIGFALGADLKNPERRYVAGLTYELFKGVNLMAVHEWARVKTLAAGYKVGDAFADTAANLPLTDRSRGGWVFGLAIDARYATGVLQGK
jgi:hypothetical protein